MYLHILAGRFSIASLVRAFYLFVFVGDLKRTEITAHMESGLRILLGALPAFKPLLLKLMGSSLFSKLITANKKPLLVNKKRFRLIEDSLLIFQSHRRINL